MAQVFVRIPSVHEYYEPTTVEVKFDKLPPTWDVVLDNVFQQEKNALKALGQSRSTIRLIGPDGPLKGQFNPHLCGTSGAPLILDLLLTSSKNLTSAESNLPSLMNQRIQHLPRGSTNSKYQRLRTDSPRSTDETEVTTQATTTMSSSPISSTLLPSQTDQPPNSNQTNMDQAQEDQPRACCYCRWLRDLDWAEWSILFVLLLLVAQKVLEAVETRRTSTCPCQGSGNATSSLSPSQEDPIEQDLLVGAGILLQTLLQGFVIWHLFRVHRRVLNLQRTRT